MSKYMCLSRVNIQQMDFFFYAHAKLQVPQIGALYAREQILSCPGRPAKIKLSWFLLKE